MNSDEFEVQHLEEPEIQFEGGSSVSPRRGLFEYGPRLKNTEHHTINIGVIGDRTSVRNLKDLFSKMETFIHPDSNDDTLRPWRIPFPGTGPNSELNVSMSMRDRWTVRFRRLVSAVESEDTPKDKMEFFLDKLNRDIAFLSSDDPEPDVIVVCIPEKVMEECTPDDQENAQVSEDGSDLHDRIKIQGMNHGVPTQLIKPSTLEINSERQRASRAWNLFVGLLYKSQRGYPWKTKDLEEGACYAGISFYRDKGADGNVVRAAMAHVYARKDYTVLQSEPMKGLKTDDNGQPHLSKSGAKQISQRIIDYYKRRNRGRGPERLIIHKTSPFWDDERQGFLEGAPDTELHDYVHIRTRNTSMRLFPSGNYPPLRGTLISHRDADIHYLYTTGFTPEMGTYEGSNIPEPIEIRPDKQCYTERDKLCKEILFLTKLDWNTSDFAVKEPVTLKVARKVSSVLSESVASRTDAEKQYFYYM